MGKRRVAKKPLDEQARKKANEALAKKTGGRPLRPEESELREEWMDAYVAAGGELVSDEKKKKKKSKKKGGSKAKKPAQAEEKCDASLSVIVKMKDGSPVKGVSVKIDGTDGTSVAGGTTGPDGVYDEKCIEPGDYFVSAEMVGMSPDETSESDEPATSNVSVGLHENKILDLVLEPILPDGAVYVSWPPKDHKQYVNLSPWSNRMARGQKIQIEAVMKGGKKGSKIYARLEPNAKNDKQPKVTSKGKKKEAWCAKGGAIEEMRGDDGTSDCEALIELDLGLTGGDDVTVHLGNSEACNHTKIKITNWRRLYYQVTRMKNSYPDPVASFAPEYKRHFIEWKKSRAPVKGPHKSVMEISPMRKYGPRHWKKTNGPQEAHIVLCDQLKMSKSDSITTLMTTMKKEFTRAKNIWPHAGWLKDATYVEVPGLSVKDLKPMVTKNGKKIIVDFTGTGFDPSKTPVFISIKFKLLRATLGGEGGDPPHFYIATALAKGTKKSMILVHEIGHGLRMVPSSGHNMHYENANGGFGDHCRTGADENQVSKAQGGTFSGTYTNGKCVMFAFTSNNTRFCGTCAPFIKKAKIQKKDMQREWGT